MQHFHFQPCKIFSSAMLALRNPVERLTRKPLQPRDTNALDSTLAKPKSILKRDATHTVIQRADKEKLETMMEGLDLSLGEELIEMRKRVERLKLDKEKTEERLRERDAVFEVWREDLERRGEEQIRLEIEMDRVYRINELRALTRISPIRSLREKEEMRFRAAPLSILKWDEDDMEESVGENSIGSPAGSSANSRAVSSKVD